MGIVEKILGAFGGSGSKTTTGESGSTNQKQMNVTLATRVPKAGNAVWEQFESLTVRYDALTLTTSEGQTSEPPVAGGFDLHDEALVDGKDSVYKMRPAPGTYESGTVSFEVLDYELQADAPDLPLEGFENATLDFLGESFELAPGDERMLTLVVYVRENDAGDAYVLNPALEW